ncbi:MAG: DUF4384 domain-containing protein [Candidatus Krumholzibacteriota bacterium]|nr:DUF4384 domain-containing protein [Candidatus Krumholzibacteriota bacterium]
MKKHHILWAALFVLIITSKDAFCGGSEILRTRLQSQYPIAGWTADQARDRAKNQIKRDAMEELCGANLISTTLSNKGILVADLIEAVSEGKVTGFKEIVDTIIAKTSDYGKTEYYCYVEAVVEVQCDSDKRDPGFQLKTGLNNAFFREGEKLVLNIQSSRDCYVHVINILENGEMHLIFPNQLQLENKLLEGDILTIPGNENFDIVLQPFENREETSEAMLIVATKADIKIPIFSKPEVDGDKISGPEVSRARYVSWLMGIDRDMRTENVEAYSIKKN